jgi:hypothetical protein
MISNAGEHVSKIVLRIEPVELGAFDQRVDGGGARPPASEPANR